MRDWTAHTQLERQSEKRGEEAGPFKTERGWAGQLNTGAAEGGQNQTGVTDEGD